MVMPETLSAAPDWLREEVVTLAWCWRLARRDGVVIGLTSHDRDLMVGGIVYRAAPGMKPSALETSDSLDAATMDLEGAIASDAIASGDLDAGRWDGAELELFVTDWSAADAVPVTVARGSLGAIERRGAAFAAELQGVTRLLDRPVCPATSPSCRAMLGDRACRVDLGAMDGIVGEVASFQALANDVWNMSCPVGSPTAQGRPVGPNCYFAAEGSVLLDHDFGAGPADLPRENGEGRHPGRPEVGRRLGAGPGHGQWSC